MFSALKKNLQSIFWIFRLIFKTNPKLVVFILICQLFATITPFIEQKQISALIDSLINYFKTNQQSWMLPFIIFILARVAKITFFIFSRTASRVEQYRQDYELRKIYTTKTSSLDFQQLEDKKTAVLMAKVSEEYLWRSREIFNDIIQLISTLFGFATVIFFLLPRYWYIALILMVGETPSLIVDSKWNRKNYRIFEEYNEKSRFGWDIFWHLVDKRYISELRINNAVLWLRTKVFKVFGEFADKRSQSQIDKLVPDLLLSALSTTVGIFCLFLIILDIKNGLLSIGMFTFYFSIVRNTGDYFSSIFSLYATISEQIPHMNNFRKILDLPNTINNGTIKNGLKNISPLIEFQHVSFKYPNTDRYIYKDLNLTIKPGEEIAIVGPNGAGKSTLVKLICRFYDPSEGKILINGQDLKKYNLDYWYRHLSLLNQEFNIYNELSLKENITIGRPKIQSNHRVWNSLKKAEASDFVKKYEKGLDTMMSQRYGGEEPSWGQWQKIAIARSFYRHAPIMILDEPTASIDAVAESKIFSRIFKEVENKTLIIISHRFSTVRNAKRILVIDNGQIVEQGTHYELLKLNGLYAKSFNLQAKGYLEV